MVHTCITHIHTPDSYEAAWIDHKTVDSGPAIFYLNALALGPDLCSSITCTDSIVCGLCSNKGNVPC